MYKQHFPLYLPWLSFKQTRLLQTVAAKLEAQTLLNSRIPRKDTDKIMKQVDKWDPFVSNMLAQNERDTHS